MDISIVIKNSLCWCELKSRLAFLCPHLWDFSVLKPLVIPCNFSGYLLAIKVWNDRVTGESQVTILFVTLGYIKFWMFNKRLPLELKFEIYFTQCHKDGLREKAATKFHRNLIRIYLFKFEIWFVLTFKSWLIITNKTGNKKILEDTLLLLIK